MHRLSISIPDMRLVVAVAMALALAASLVATGTARAALITFTAELTAEAEVPTPGPDGATGSAVIRFDDETNELCYELTIDGIDGGDAVIAAHIHEGEAGVAGDVVVPLFTEPPTGEMTGCVEDVDADVMAAIQADPEAYYVNIHTEAYQAGAVRGQLTLEGASEGCQVSVEPATVSVGDDFVVSGNFGGAEIYFVEGAGSNIPEDAEPVATVPQSETSFSLTFTAEAGDEGTWTIWAILPASECGDSAQLTIEAATVPDTAATSPGIPVGLALGVLLLGLALQTTLRLRRLTVDR